MVTSARSLNSAECWLDSTCGVVRYERKAVGLDGEQYAWTQLFVCEFVDGRCTGLCDFELDDEVGVRVRGRADPGDLQNRLEGRGTQHHDRLRSLAFVFQQCHDLPVGGRSRVDAFDPNGFQRPA